MCVCLECTTAHSTYAGAYIGQKRAPDSLELELVEVVRAVGSGDLCKNINC